MDPLAIYLQNKLVGTIAQLDGGELAFIPQATYEGSVFSLAMPSSGQEYRGRVVRAWFDNLLPDDHRIRRGMAQRAGTSSGIFQLLAHYGLDLPGAVQVVSRESEDAFLSQRESFVRITEEEIGQRLKQLVEDEQKARLSLWAAKNEHWSLGGNQAKIAFRRFNNAWDSCEGSAASNVIVKPGVSHLAAQALNECVTMRLAMQCGLPTAPVHMHQFANVWAIVVERFDRLTDENGHIERVHQEDMCQALGYVSEKKYAEDGGPSAPQIMNIVGSVDTEGKKRFADALLFNHLTASTDGHAKNYSFLHFEDGTSMLAPLYDVASLAPYITNERRTPYHLAMGIGGETRVGHLRKTPLQRFARFSGLDETWVFDRAFELSACIQKHLPAVFNEPDLAGVEHLDELASRMIPRIQALCRGTERNLERTGKNYVPVKIAHIKAM